MPKKIKEEQSIEKCEWKAIFQSAARDVKNIGLKEKDVAGAISSYRIKKIYD